MTPTWRFGRVRHCCNGTVGTDPEQQTQQRMKQRGRHVLDLSDWDRRLQSKEGHEEVDKEDSAGEVLSQLEGLLGLLVLWGWEESMIR